MKKINQRGFTLVEVLLILVILGVVGFLGWYVYQSYNSANKSLKKSISDSTSLESKASEENNKDFPKSYTDKIGNFTVYYPEDWSIETTENNEGPWVSSSSKITSPSGTVLTLEANYGGKGGGCTPEPNDKPFQTGNSCNSYQILSSELAPIDNVYTSKEKVGNDDSDIVEFEKGKNKIYLQTVRFADSEGKSEYLMGLSDFYPEGLQKQEAGMGFYLPVLFFHVQAQSYKESPYIYAYTTGNSLEFFEMEDVKMIKEILMNLKVNI